MRVFYLGFDAFSRLLASVGSNERFLRHLGTRCQTRCNSLAVKISPLLSESQYDGSVLVTLAQLAAPASGHFTRETPAVRWVSSRVCTTPEREAKRCFLRSLSCWSAKTLGSNRSEI